MDKLTEARNRINAVDAQMAPLFEERMRAVEDVIAYKIENGLPIFDAAREEAVITRGCERIENEGYRPYYADFLRGMMRVSKAYQQSLVSSCDAGTALQQIYVDLKPKGYTVYMGRGDFLRLAEFADVNCKVLILTDDGVPAQYAEAVKKQCPQSWIMTVVQGEGSKSFATLEAVCARLLELKFGRKDMLIAVGGGVIGDLGGFAASMYMRGIRFINMPTTVLSQVDSSIGGKTAINVNGVKNSVGAFYQPELVVADPDVLKTLDKRQVSNGLVEALKAGLIADEKLFSLFEETDVYSRLDEIIYRSVVVKKNVVEQDEKETGLRRILNFGHTIGHGVESVYGLSGLLHGESVAVGMLPMITDDILRERTRACLKKIEVNPDLPYDADAVFEAMTRDKKAHGDSISVICVEKAGGAQICEVKTESLKSLLKGETQ